MQNSLGENPILYISLDKPELFFVHARHLLSLFLNKREVKQKMSIIPASDSGRCHLYRPAGRAI